jgi:hypothetical protein
MRIDYPDNEFSVNADNVETAAEQQFGSVEADHYGSRLWWDVNQPPAEVRP